jgi:hypothetical protein
VGCRKDQRLLPGDPVDADVQETADGGSEQKSGDREKNMRRHSCTFNRGRNDTTYILIIAFYREFSRILR